MVSLPVTQQTLTRPAMPGEVLCFQKCAALDEAKCLQLNLFSKQTFSKCLEVVVCVILGLGLFSSTFFSRICAYGYGEIWAVTCSGGLAGQSVQMCARVTRLPEKLPRQNEALCLSLSLSVALSEYSRFIFGYWMHN